MIPCLRYAVLILALAAAVWLDQSRGRIPNKLNLTLAAAALVLALAQGRPLWALAGFAAGTLLGMGGWLLHLFRAGDAKLFMALGLALGWRGLVGCAAWSLVVGAALGLVLLLIKGQLTARLARVGRYLKLLLFTRSFSPYEPAPGTEREFPFALSIALGTALSLLVPLF